jgi:hypothetical protein
VITIRANDAASAALGPLFDARRLLPGHDTGELGRRLREGGLARDEQGALYVPGLSYRQPHVPTFPTLMERECWMNSWHLDNHPDVPVSVSDDCSPHIGNDGQLHMLQQGIALSRIVLELARAQSGQPPVTCITTINSTCGVFKFHESRPGERYLPAGTLDTRGVPHPLVGITMTLEIEEGDG